jgi:hypothetical protein
VVGLRVGEPTVRRRPVIATDGRGFPVDGVRLLLPRESGSAAVIRRPQRRGTRDSALDEGQPVSGSAGSRLSSASEAEAANTAPMSTTYPPGTPSCSAHVACHSDSIPAPLAARLSHDVSSAPMCGAIRQIGSYTPIRSPHPGQNGGTSPIPGCICKASSGSPRGVIGTTVRRAGADYGQRTGPLGGVGRLAPRAGVALRGFHASRWRFVGRRKDGARPEHSAPARPVAAGSARPSKVGL